MFRGFSDKTADFLWGIRFNNERPWFQEHKEEYQAHVQKPMKDLADEMYDWFCDQYPKLSMTVHLSRIYRDARRLFGRGPFKDHLWFSIQCGERWQGTPCFYFEVAPEGYGYGMGYFAESADLARRFREEIDRDVAAFEKLAGQAARQEEFVLGGPAYSRPKGHAGTLVGEWYNKKSWSLSADRPYDELCTTHDLAEHLKMSFKTLMPYYEFALRAWQRAE